MNRPGLLSMSRPPTRNFSAARCSRIVSDAHSNAALHDACANAHDLWREETGRYVGVRRLVWWLRMSRWWSVMMNYQGMCGFIFYVRRLFYDPTSSWHQQTFSYCAEWRGYLAISTCHEDVSIRCVCFLKIWHLQLFKSLLTRWTRTTTRDIEQYCLLTR